MTGYGGLLAGVEVKDDYIELEPPRASLGQLQLTNKLEMIRVEDDVLGVVERLKRIDRGLFLLYDKGQEIYVLYRKYLNAKGELVEDRIGAYTELDARLVALIERIDAQGRGHPDLARELDRLEEARDREHEAEMSERYGEAAERLRHAIRKDLGAEGSSVQPGYSRGIHRARSEQRAKLARAARRQQRDARKANRQR